MHEKSSTVKSDEQGNFSSDERARECLVSQGRVEEWGRAGSVSKLIKLVSKWYVIYRRSTRCFRFPPLQHWDPASEKAGYETWKAEFLKLPLHPLLHLLGS